MLKTFSLEEEVLKVLRALDSASLDQIYSALSQRGIKTTRESVRKVLERLILKGKVRKVSRNYYALNQLRLDFFLKDDELDRYISSKIFSKIIGLSPSTLDTVSGEFLRHLKENNVKIRKVSDLRSIRAVLGSEFGGSVADDSSRPLKSHVYWYGGTIIRVSSRIRIGGVLGVSIEVNDPAPTLSVDENMRLLPEHLEKGGTTEFKLERMKVPFIQSYDEINKIKKEYNLDFETTKEVAEKLSDYDIIDFNQSLIRLALNEAVIKASSYDLAIAFIDGSILPGHLDPYYTPDYLEKDEEEKELPDEVVETILERKERILRNFMSIYEEVRSSKNVILVGAIKRSNDMSLQALTNTYYDVPDSNLLFSILKEEGILGPFIKHRVKKELIEQLKKFNIPIPKEEDPKDRIRKESIIVNSYYIKGRVDMMPLQVDIIFPRDMDEEMLDKVVDLFYYLIEPSERHTSYSIKSGGEGWFIPTLRPIKIVDEKISAKSKEIEIIFEKELAMKLFELLSMFRELAIKYNVDMAVFAYNSASKSFMRVRE